MNGRKENKDFGKHHLFNGYGEEMERKCATKFI